MLTVAPCTAATFLVLTLLALLTDHGLLLKNACANLADVAER